MRSIAWPDNPTIEDIPDRLVELVRAGANTGQLANEIHHALYHGGTIHEINDDGRVVYQGETRDPEEGAIIQYAYHADASKIIDIVSRNDDG